MITITETCWDIESDLREMRKRLSPPERSFLVVDFNQCVKFSNDGSDRVKEGKLEI